MRAITIAFTGVFLTGVLAAGAMPVSILQSGSHAVEIQQKKAEKKKNDAPRPSDNPGY